MELNSKTVFIIGAGAHVPYEFPTSQGLTKILKGIYSIIKGSKFHPHNDNVELLKIFHKNILSIAGELQKEISYKTTLPTNTSLADSFLDFLKSFCHTQVYSIDSYLSKNFLTSRFDIADEHSWWGRIVIAYLISHYENAHSFEVNEFDWIQFLINNFIKDDEKVFFENPFKFITFNYDRLLEQSLYSHLTYYHGLSSNEADTKIKSLGIIHVYGCLNDYKVWAEEDKLKNIAFYKSAIENIRVVGDERTDILTAKVFEEIKSVLVSAKKIYFLGFGFDEYNMEVLKNNGLTLLDRVKSYSTNIGVDNQVLKRVKNCFNDLPMYLQLNTDKEKIDCLELIKRTLVN